MFVPTATPPGRISREVSAILNKLHRIMGNATGETLRNRNGVYLKVMNFRSSDPHYLDQGKVGMERGNKLEGVIWQEYADDPLKLATDARAIRATILAADDTALSQHPLEPPYEGEGHRRDPRCASTYAAHIL